MKFEGYFVLPYRRKKQKINAGLCKVITTEMITETCFISCRENFRMAVVTYHRTRFS